MQTLYKIRLLNSENELFFNKQSYKFQPKGAAMAANSIMEDGDRYCLVLNEDEDPSDFVENVKYELVETEILPINDI